ncbi:MAG: sle [Acidimicrobiales bacterium]|nr:sle [Acidimicrobiales bacterium]
MTTTDPASRTTGATAREGRTPGEDRKRRVRRTTETKAGYKTTEFMLGVLFVVAVIVAAYASGDDSMSRDDGWRYAAIVLTGYVVSRGLAKAGTYEPYTDEIDLR